MPLHTHARLAPGQPPSASHTTGISRQRRALEGCHINGADVQGERLSAIRPLIMFLLHSTLPLLVWQAGHFHATSCSKYHNLASNACLPCLALTDLQP